MAKTKKSPPSKKTLEKIYRNVRQEAKEKFGSTKSERARAYIYGTLRNTGWKPPKERKSKNKSKSKRHHSAPNGKWLDARFSKFNIT